MGEHGSRWRVVPGRPEAAFEASGGLITKAEIRAVSLAQLGLCDGDTLWDVGAGSGSVAIEAAASMPAGRAYAVERRPERAAMIRRNAARHGVANCEIVVGEAPGALKDLPAPDRVFIGGHGGNLEAIIAVCAERLKPGGVIVVNAVTPETVESARRGLAEEGFTVQATLLNVARLEPLADGREGWRALNPVTVLQAARGRHEP